MFSSGKILLRFFFQLRVKMEIFLKEDFSHLLLLNSEWLWKLAFAADLIIFLNELNLKTIGQNWACIQNLYYNKVILMTTNVVWITSDIKLLYSLPMSSKMKTRSEISIPHKFAGNIFFRAQPIVQQYFWDLNAHSKESPIFQNPSNCAVEELPLNLQLK